MSDALSIAIVGAAGRFPAAPDLETFWANIVARKDAAREVPAERWPVSAATLRDSGAARPDRLTSIRACLLDPFEVSADEARLAPELLKRLDPVHRLALRVGLDAFRSVRGAPLDGARTAVVLANIALPTDGASSLARELVGEKSSAAPQDAFPCAFPAGLLCRALGLGGGSFTLDAACASSLYAIALACEELMAGRIDAALAGGLSRPQSLYTQVGFSQLQALSPSGRCSPFDTHADGLVVGEGAGVFVLRRLEDAVASGDQILGVIRGVGLSNDVGGSLLSPASEGQLRAMRAAYASAGWKPSEVQLIECHGTGTPRGDGVELESLRTLFEGASGAPRVIGSVKSNVGHLLTGAGAAGLAKVLQAMKHRTLPPSANFAATSAAPGLQSAPVRVLENAEAWEPSGPRRAAVSAFGFGGINAHLLVEEFTPESKKPSRPPRAPEPVAIVGMAAHIGRLEDLEAFQHAVLRGEPVADARPESRWKGADALVPDELRNLKGAWIEKLEVPVGRFKIPPREIPSVLPQQLLMLKVAAEALEDAGGSSKGPQLRTGALIGLGLDQETTTFHLRWLERERAAKAELSASETEKSCDALGPALDAQRTLGALGGIVASRIAREFELGGPCFGLSGDETSGLRALETATRLLQRGEIDRALVGAVDLAGDVRQVKAAHALRKYSASGRTAPFDAAADGPTLGEGAVALVVKRLSDAQCDGDRIYAVVSGLGSGSGERLEDGYRAALERAWSEAKAAPVSAGLLEAHGSAVRETDAAEATALVSHFTGGERRTALSSTRAVVGDIGAASGLASVVKTALCLFHEVLPPLPGFKSPAPGTKLDGSALHVPHSAQVWLRDRADGPRRAGVSSIALSGTCMHVVLEGIERTAETHEPLRARPLGERSAALFLIESESELEAFARARPSLSVEELAAAWHRSRRATTSRRAVVANDRADLERQLASPRAAATRISGELAFVFPGSGNHYVGMGRALGIALPAVYRALDAETEHLAGQLMPQWYAPWRTDWRDGWEQDAARSLASAPERLILGQVAHGIAVHDALRLFGVKAQAYFGYSLGESAALFSSRAWRARDLMFQRTLASPLFKTELLGENTVMRAAWGEGAEWRAAIVNRPADEVRRALEKTASLLIVNAPGECVIGGRAEDVDATVKRLGCEAIRLEGVPTVHMPLVERVGDAYRGLHELPTSPIEARFYSCAWAKPYVPSEKDCAQSILDNAVHGFDFTAAVERAYADGVRVFVEAGPQGSCARMISRILAGRRHLAVSACQRGQDGFRSLLQALAKLSDAGVPVDLEAIYGERGGIRVPEVKAKPPSVTVVLGGKIERRPMPARPARPAAATVVPTPAPVQQVTRVTVAAPPSSLQADLKNDLLRTSAANAAAHERFLELSRNALALQTNALLAQQQLIAQLASATEVPLQLSMHVPPPQKHVEPPQFDREKCMEFAVGELGRMLGDAFAPVDANPTRVRLPDEPLMLVDRIVKVEGTPRGLDRGRVITEHDVHAGAWYLDGGRAPVCISVEAGQADLFLSAYLGIDFETRGERVYRLLDAKIVFHRDLPKPGETIRYDIRIDRFIRQGDTWLFFFRFDGTIDGEPLITMYDGCAGFFSAEQLASGRGIVAEPKEEKRTRRTLADGTPAPEYAPLLPLSSATCDERQIEALRRGDLAACFGSLFDGLTLAPELRLPTGRMQLVDRILELEPTGGRFGLGTVLGEHDVAPDAWYLTCHFKDDPVMPGTLMYECCLHTLRVLLLRMGWITESSEGDLHYAPIEGVASRLRCRGQVIPGTKKVQYRIELKEVGYDPEPYVIANAQMYADGRHVVEMEDMSVRVRGLSKERVEQLWAARAPKEKTVVYDAKQILAYAVGNPSEGFGERYRVFDRERRLARLPGPPFLFMDRVLSCGPQPWVLKAGGWVESEYDVPRDAWYFGANKQRGMPFAVLLEAALQPCGWLAAYLGSALTSDEDLQFRNLDGQAVMHEEVTPDVGTITQRARLTKTSQAGGMILQEFELELLAKGRRIYSGTTGFGFFPAKALANQVGLRGAPLIDPPRAHGFELPRTAPLTPSELMPLSARGLELPGRAFSMIDRVEALSLDGGPKGLGYVVGTKRVDPAEWFFAAHFYQDPVMPGSLGLEAMLQLMKLYARERFGALASTHRFESMAVGRAHKWTYRGQVIPTNREVTVQARITAVEDGPSPVIVADGNLVVDGRVIYGMTDFALRLVPEEKR